MTAPDLRPLDTTALPDTFGAMMEWLGGDPRPRRPLGRAAVIVAGCVLALAACTIPVEFEHDLGQALIWTSSASPAEAARTSQRLFRQLDGRTFLGYRLEHDAQGRFVHRLAVAGATPSEAGAWRRQLGTDPSVTGARVEAVTESRHAPLAAALLSELRLVTDLDAGLDSRMSLEEEMARMQETFQAESMDYEMVEILPPAPGTDKRRRRFRVRHPDGTVQDGVVGGAVGERERRSRQEVLRDRQELADWLHAEGLDSTLAPTPEEVLRVEGYGTTD